MDDTKEEKRQKITVTPHPRLKIRRKKNGIYAHHFGVLTLELSVERN